MKPQCCKLNLYQNQGFPTSMGELAVPFLISTNTAVVPASVKEDAILFWGWNSTIEIEIDPTVTVGYLENSIYKAADSLKLPEKLQGGKLVITLRNVPGKFVYQNKGNVLFLLVAYTMSGIEAITPAQKALVATFEVQDGDKVTSGGDVLVRNSDKPVKNIWKTTKKFTWSYVDLYRSDTEKMGSELVRQMGSELVHQKMQKLEGEPTANNDR